MAGIHAPSETTARETLQTTLYDLVAAISEVAGADEDAVITATVMHLLNFHDIRCVGDFEGYRLVCEAETPPKGDDGTFSHFESSIYHSEKMADREEREGKEWPCLAMLTNR
jgi:hypothetical protein